MAQKKKLGEMLLEAGLIDEDQLNSALAYQREWGGKLGSILMKRGRVRDADLVAVIEKQTGTRSVAFDAMKPLSPELKKLVPLEVAQKFEFFPLKFDGRMLEIATTDPTDLKAMDDIGFKIGVRVKAFVAHEEDIQDAISLHYGLEPGSDVLRRRKAGQHVPAPSERGGDQFELVRNPSHEAVHAQPQTQRDREPVRTEDPAPGKSPDSSVASIVDFQQHIIDSLIDLLMEKNVFTRAELFGRLKNYKKGE